MTLTIDEIKAIIEPMGGKVYRLTGRRYKSLNPAKAWRAYLFGVAFEPFGSGYGFTRPNERSYIRLQWDIVISAMTSRHSILDLLEVLSYIRPISERLNAIGLKKLTY